tara:strand:+ start:12009 stop:12401 length:393 start_codon:yes stop_codon:yes gene_type:complete
MVNQQRKEHTMTKPTPIDHIRFGAINAAIWANQTDSGTRYGITFERLYRDPESGKWKSSQSFNRDDLLIIAKVADQAHSRVYELQTLERNQSRDDSGDAAIAETQPKPPVPRTGGASAPVKAKALAGASR